MTLLRKQKEPHSEEQLKKRNKLFFDARVKHILNCDSCDTPITLSESKRNHGLCDDCVQSHSYLE